MPGKKKKPIPSPESWYCKACNSHNQKEYVACRTCGIFKIKGGYYTPSDKHKENLQKAKNLAKKELTEEQKSKRLGDVNEDIKPPQPNEPQKITISWECTMCGEGNCEDTTECIYCGYEDEIQAASTTSPHPVYEDTQPTLFEERTKNLLEGVDENLVATCEVCYNTVGLHLMVQHLEAHFAFAMLQTQQNKESHYAAELQLEEMKSFLENCRQNAEDRTLSMAIAARDDTTSWTCFTCKQRNTRDTTICAACAGKKPQKDSKKYVPSIHQNTGTVKLSTMTMQPIRHASGTEISQIAYKHINDGEAVVTPSTEEYNIIVGHFIRTLTGAEAIGVRVKTLTRWHNPVVLAQYMKVRGTQTLMFHGTRTMENHRSIKKTGFLVSKCVSGGVKFGTWLAYISAYSDAGFVSVEGPDRYILLCLVKNSDTRLNNSTMRVVGPNCAYPCYSLCYSR